MEDRTLPVRYENKKGDTTITFHVTVPGTEKGEEWLERQAIKRVELLVSQWFNAKDANGNVKADYKKFAQDLDGKTVDFVHLDVGPDKHSAVDTVRINTLLTSVRALRENPAFAETSTADICTMLNVSEEYQDTVCRIIDAE